MKLLNTKTLFQSKIALRYKFLLLKIAIAFSVLLLNSTCFILLYRGDVFVFHMLASQIAISRKEDTHMGRLYIFVVGGITFMLFNVRLCGIIFAYSHLLAYCLLCGDMSVNPLLLITHCQDENRQLISFWNEYSWRSMLGGVCCWKIPCFYFLPIHSLNPIQGYPIQGYPIQGYPIQGP